ncbi:GNAT family N-acetyltransferase [Candidatus Gottesmanbacteria bacterium]|nr:GNAT family N-acetyltransferase [Candidatus Gottesmanbacteria bacterium]
MTQSVNLDDIPSLLRLGRQIFLTHQNFDYTYYELEGNFDELFTNWIKQHINQPQQFILVAIESEESPDIVGFISGFLKALYPWFKTKTVGHISYLVVDPQFRQKGVGKLLEQEAREWFKNKNIAYIEVYVDEKNAIGQEVWNSYGFLPFKKFLRKKI